MVEPIFGRAQQYLSHRKGLCKVPSFKKCGLITTALFYFHYFLIERVKKMSLRVQENAFLRV